MKLAFVKPMIPGSIIRYPNSARILPDAGDTVPLNQYWSRRIKQRDVVVGIAPSSIPDSFDSKVSKEKRGVK